MTPGLLERARRARLIALDLDGTTLTSDKQITPRTAAVLRALVASGRHVTFATGRMLGSTARYAEQVGLELPHVVLNGSLVARRGESPLYGGALPAEVLADSRVGVPDGVGLFWLTGETLYSEPRWASHWDYLRSWNNGGDQEELADLREIERHPVYQLHWVGPADALETIAARYRDDVRWRLLGFASSQGPMHHLELRQAGTHKGTGLAHLQRLLGVSQEETLAVGDWINDLDMLRVAGVGVAMGNACPEVRAVAEGVLDGTNDEDGLARFLERLVQSTDHTPSPGV